jgi:hypothetical protein
MLPETAMPLERRLAELERQVQASSLHSPKFLKRAFAVWGHYFIANLFIGGAISVIVGLLSLLIALMVGN